MTAIEFWKLIVFLSLVIIGCNLFDFVRWYESKNTISVDVAKQNGWIDQNGRNQVYVYRNSVSPSLGVWTVEIYADGCVSQHRIMRDVNPQPEQTK